MTTEKTDADVLAELVAKVKQWEEEFGIQRRQADLEREKARALLDFEILGTFSVSSERLRVTDPCYSVTTWCSGSLPVKPGTYTAAVKRHAFKGDNGFKRITELLTWHESSNQEQAALTSLDSGIHVGVDSGQAGFFDAERYPSDGSDDEAFYNLCGDHTLGFRSAGVIDFGAVASSGFGDGGYQCFVDSKEVATAARIVFIDKDYEDDGELPWERQPSDS